MYILLFGLIFFIIILLLENLCYHLWSGKRTQALDARQGQQMEGSEERTSFGLDRTRFQLDLGVGFIGGGRGQHVSRCPASIQWNATCLFIFYSIFSFWKTSIESEQCHSNRRLFIIFIFWRKKVKNQPIFSGWDKSDTVDGSHILITLASIRRRGFLSRTKNVLLDPKSSPQNVRSVSILI